MTNKRETSTELAKRLKNAGLWEQFCACRLGYVDEGHQLKRAYVLASEDPRFLPGATFEDEVDEGEVVDPSVWDGKKAAPAAEVMWVADSLEGDPQPADAPSASAWSLLCWAKSSSAAMNAFFVQHYGKLLKDSQTADPLVDDGDPVILLIDQIEQASQQANDKVDAERLVRVRANRVAAQSAMTDVDYDEWQRRHAPEVERFKNRLRDDPTLRAQARSEAKAQENRSVAGATGSKPW